MEFTQDDLEKFNKRGALRIATCAKNRSCQTTANTNGNKRQKNGNTNDNERQKRQYERQQTTKKTAVRTAANDKNDKNGRFLSFIVVRIAVFVVPIVVFY